MLYSLLFTEYLHGHDDVSLQTQRNQSIPSTERTSFMNCHTPSCIVIICLKLTSRCLTQLEGWFNYTTRRNERRL